MREWRCLCGCGARMNLRDGDLLTAWDFDHFALQARLGSPRIQILKQPGFNAVVSIADPVSSEPFSSVSLEVTKQTADWLQRAMEEARKGASS